MAFVLVSLFLALELAELREVAHVVELSDQGGNEHASHVEFLDSTEDEEDYLGHAADEAKLFEDVDG